MAAPQLICLLDDESCVLKALGRLLASEGLHNQQFTDPVLFLEFASSSTIAVAVIDVRMPGMSGIEVQAALRANGAKTRVIIMTAEDDPINRAAAMAGGATAFLVKPLDSEIFIQAVRSAMKAQDDQAVPG